MVEEAGVWFCSVGFGSEVLGAPAPEEGDDVVVPGEAGGRFSFGNGGRINMNSNFGSDELEVGGVTAGDDVPLDEDDPGGAFFGEAESLAVPDAPVVGVWPVGF